MKDIRYFSNLMILNTAIAFGVLAANPVTAAPKWQQKMSELAQTMGDLLPELVSKQPDKKQIEKGAKKLSELAHGLNKDSKQFSPSPDADPSITYLASLFEKETKRAYWAAKGGRTEYARKLLLSVTGYCIACHTRHDKGPEFPTFPLSAKIQSLGKMERADLFAATRQFDKALAEYRAIAQDQEVAKTRRFEWERSFRRATAIAVRVKKDPTVALTFVNGVLAMPNTPDYMAEYLKKWKESLVKWQKESADVAKTEDGFLLEEARLLQEGQSLQRYPIDQGGAIQYLRASAMAHEMLGTFPNGKRVAEGLFVEGQAYEALSGPGFDYLPDMYYEGCIRQSPHSEIAGQCYRRYEESVYFGYTGSGGTHLPFEVERELHELRELAQPIIRTN